MKTGIVLLEDGTLMPKQDGDTPLVFIQGVRARGKQKYMIMF